MKSFTDIEQSKKLAEILPVESADMCYLTDITFGGKCRFLPKDDFACGDSLPNLPCWSLAALLNIIPYPSLHKTFSGWRCDSYNKEGTSCKLGEPSVNPVDACYEMIIKLKEQKLL